MIPWTKEQEIALINKTQDEYVHELIDILNSHDPSVRALEEVNFTSPTGTGKTKMMATIINQMPNDYFIVTTLSKGQLHKQVSKALENDCPWNNFKVYGVQSYTKNSILQDDDILAEIQSLPSNARVFWFRDEGHIKSNKWMKLLQKRCDKIVNWSATNNDAFGVKCNFTHTMMLRTVQQAPGDIDMALDKLIEIKKQHRCVQGYNPCAVIRLTSTALLDTVTKSCKKRKLSYISLLQNDDYDMSELCEDDCEYDVIINQQKIVEGIDIRRAHVLWMENEPAKAATTIQMIGRCRRNALLWRDDVDICAPENQSLLEQTRQCFAFYNEKHMKIDEDENGELASEFCPIITVEKLKCGSVIRVTNGVMSNGLQIAELEGCTGEYTITKDPQTGFNMVDNPCFYETKYIIRGLQFDRQEPLQWLHTINNHIQSHPQWCSNVEKEITTYIHHKSFLFATYTQVGDEVVATTREYNINNDGIFNHTTHTIPFDEASILGIALQHHTRVYAHSRPLWLIRDQLAITINETQYHLFFSEIDYILRNSMLTLGALDPRRFAQKEWIYEYEPDICITNNQQLAILGPEMWRLQRIHTYATHQREGSDECEWVPDIATTKRVSQYSKFSTFLKSTYKNEYHNACQQVFKKNVQFDFPKLANRALGFIVEHYAKAQIYGDEYLEPYYSRVIRDEVGYDTKRYSQTAIRIRACFIKYREEMKRTYSMRSARFLPAIGLDKLTESQYTAFISEVERLGTQTAEFLRLYTNVDDRLINPMLQSQSLAGLMDVITSDTVIDVKCTGSIDERMILQVLSYVYMSQYVVGRNIKQAIIYDACTNNALIIPVITQCCHNGDSTMQNILHQKLTDAQKIPPKPQLVIDENRPSEKNLECIASIINIQTQMLFREHVKQCLAKIPLSEFLEQCNIRHDVAHVILSQYNNTAMMFQELCIDKMHLSGVGPVSIENITQYSNTSVQTDMVISDKPFTPLEETICRTIRTNLLSTDTHDSLHSDVIQRFDDYADAWTLLSRYNPTPIKMRFKLQTPIISARCEYWDDEYIASQQNDGMEATHV